MLPSVKNHPLLSVICVAGTSLLSSPALADRFDTHSEVRSAVLYPSGAMITRDVTLSVPAGQHEIVLADIPLMSQTDNLLESLQVTVEGAVLGSVSYGMQEMNDATLYRTEAAQAAKAKLDALKETLTERQRAVEEIRLEITAAQDSLAYLARLSTVEGASAEQMAATAEMIRTQSLSARRAAQDAEARAEQAEKDLKELKQEIVQAERALTRLVPDKGPRVEITLPISVDADREVYVSLSYMSDNAFWEPKYTARLDTEAGSLDLTRSVFAVQDTGEPWLDVALSFATDNPSAQAEPSEVSEYIRRIFDPNPPADIQLKARGAVSADLSGYAEPVMETAITYAPAVLTGLSQTYDYPELARLYSGEEGQEFALSTVSLQPDIKIRAVPLYHDIGFVMADFTNDTGEMLVPGVVRLIRDGVSLGETYIGTVADGEKTELAFGEVRGVQVKRVLLTRNEGDRGVISKSNESETAWRIEVKNLTARSWPIEVVDRVSVSEQEDLRVDWTATPMPDEEGMDDKRGVLVWRFDLGASESTDIGLSETLRWPEGKVLR